MTCCRMNEGYSILSQWPSNRAEREAMPIVPPGTVRDTGAEAGDVLVGQLPAHRGMRIQIAQDEPGGGERTRLQLKSLLASPFRLLDAGVTGFEEFGFVGKAFASGADFKEVLVANSSKQWKCVAVENLRVEQGSAQPKSMTASVQRE